jgi:hypothetical protein
MRSGSPQYIACDGVTGRCSSNYGHRLGDSATYARRCRFRLVSPLKLASAFAWKGRPSGFDRIGCSDV